MDEDFDSDAFDESDYSDDEKQGTYLSNLVSNNSAFC